MKALDDHEIVPLDVVVVNLYPFEDKVAKGVPFLEAVENIDIGGPTMVRAAAKNFASVAVVVDPADYNLLLEQLDRPAGLDPATRPTCPEAFRNTARYEATIAAYFARSKRERGSARHAARVSFRIGSTSPSEIQDLATRKPPSEAAFYSDLDRALLGAAARRSRQGASFNPSSPDARGACRTSTTRASDHNPRTRAARGGGSTLKLRPAWQAAPLAFGGILASPRVYSHIEDDRVGFVECVIAPLRSDARRSREQGNFGGHCTTSSQVADSDCPVVGGSRQSGPSLLENSKPRW